MCLGVPSVPLAHEEALRHRGDEQFAGRRHVFPAVPEHSREAQGLAYAVFSELTPYSDAGMLTVYAGTAKETVDQVMRSDRRANSAT